MNEIPHLGFKYHYPRHKWDSKVFVASNWWINFESNMIYIKSISKIYSVTFVEENNTVYIIFDDGNYKKRVLPFEIQEAYSSHVADKILLE